jgi:hypothetical protein
MIEINKMTAPDYSEHGKDYYIELYINILIENAPKFQYWGTHDVFRSTNPLEQDTRRFNDLQQIIFQQLLLRNLVRQDTEIVWRLMLLPKVEPIDVIHKSIHVHGSNYGNINQDSLLEKSPININVAETPAKKETKSIFLRFYDWINNNKIVSGLILAFLIALIKKQAIFGWVHEIMK